MKKDEMERRSYQFDVKAEKRADGVSTISGTPIVYSSPTDIGGWFREIIEPGALDGADLKDVPLLVNHDATACLAHCPCVDAPDRVNCKPAITRTFFRAVADYEMPIAEALKTISPIHRLEDMPHIPYHIINDLADELFPAEQMDEYVEKLLGNGHDVTYHRLEGCTHGMLTAEEWDNIRGFLLTHLTRS